MLAHEEEQAQAFLEPLNISLFIWPIGCSLYAQNVLAQINGNNEIQQITPALTTPIKTYDPTPFMRKTSIMSGTETHWGLLIWESNRLEIYNTPQTWMPEKNMTNGGFQAPEKLTPFQATALEALSQPQPLRALEVHLSSLSALTFGAVVQYWVTTLSQNNEPVTQKWYPMRAIVAGSRTVTQATLHVNGVQLLISCISVLALAVVTISTLARPPYREQTYRDAGVLDMISLLHHSSLPRVIRGGDDQSFEARRRKRAESTTVMYVPPGPLPIRLNWVIIPFSVQIRA